MVLILPLTNSTNTYHLINQIESDYVSFFLAKRIEVLRKGRYL